MTEITFATPADLPAVHAMIAALSIFHGDTAQVTMDELQTILFGPTPLAIALIAKSDGAAIGYAGLTSTIVLHQGKLRIDIHHLFVDEAYRAKGVGTALIAAATSYAKGQNTAGMTIGTDPDNAVSIAAYRAMPMLTEMSGFGPRFSVDLTD